MMWVLLITLLLLTLTSPGDSYSRPNCYRCQESQHELCGDPFVEGKNSRWSLSECPDKPNVYCRKNVTSDGLVVRECGWHREEEMITRLHEGPGCYYNKINQYVCICFEGGCNSALVSRPAIGTTLLALLIF